ncbi:thioredoxin domain-containing protein [Olivibacter ginsenosidimutans]|uniref:Thioredoxin domain-containing protein n=1 Tax=Olivibacter ginsenosidimutans TaxID=1176537 RepID=A0ABP9BFE2_9SPHI
MANHLQHETSPYLKQHQHNPVDWYPWGEEALTKAKKENKLLIVSIGYAACHWCHVMERESFENVAVAEVMNEGFVSIKIDREERPDIDQIYMTAVQLMTNSGGWPLNCICLPDGRPIYGGTYFRPDDWINILQQLEQLWANDPQTAFDYAERLTQGIKDSESLQINRIPDAYTKADLNAIISPWRHSFDNQYGGYNRAPKFPLPNNWLFLLRYGFLAKDQEILTHTHFTLQHIAAGGIYDHVGGGFARYSVDGQWHIPHFEKMLYDNAQLVSLYAEAYLQQRTPVYRRVVEETLEWVHREMISDTGGFYSSLDADSEGVEGKYYTFNQEEFESILGNDAPFYIRYFGLTPNGNWEDEGTNVLKTEINADKLAAQMGYQGSNWERDLKDTKKKLWHYREQRKRPALDNKILTSWNALMLKAYVDAYRAFAKEEYLRIAKENAHYLLDRHVLADGKLLHQSIGANNNVIYGFLDDYAFTIESLISLYEATFELHWLNQAKRLLDYTLEHFYDNQKAAFYYTADNVEILITRKFEIMDNVIPASNSVMSHQLYKLGLLFDNAYYRQVSAQLMANVFPQLKSYGSAYSNWSIRLLEIVYGVYEIAITGSQHHDLRKAADQYYIPNKILLGGQQENLPLLKGRITSDSLIYVCKNNTCSLPVSTIEGLKKLILEPEIE